MRVKPCDPQWSEISASLRPAPKKEGGHPVLYIKLPHSTAFELVQALRSLKLWKADFSPKVWKTVDSLRVWLFDELHLATNPSLFLRVDIQSLHHDLDNLLLVESKDSTNIIHAWREALTKGLANDPEVDWLARIGYPPEPLNPSVEEVPEEIIVLED